MKFFTSYKSYHKSVLHLGIPVVLGQLGQIALGWIDNIMVGHYSAEALAAASFVNMMFNLPILFGLGFAYGLTPIVADLLGKRDYYGIGKYLKNSLLLNTLMALVMILVMVIILLNIHNLGQPKELIPLIIPYFEIQLVSFIFIMGFNTFKQFSDGIMKTQTPMWIMLGCNLLNVVGNYLLIYGKFGLPELGLAGAGLSTLFARIVMLASIFCIFYFGKSYRRYRIGFNKSKLNRACSLKLNEMGLFIGLQMGLENGAFSISVVMMGIIGVEALAAHQILCTITTIGFMVYYGIGAAIAILVSNFAAKNQWKDVKMTVNAGFHIILVFVLFASTIFLLTRNEIGYLFVNDASVVSLVALLMFPVILFQFGDGLQITYANALRGLQDVKAMALISFICYILLALPCSYLMAFVAGWGALGVWMGFPIGLTVAGLLFFFRFKYIVKHRQRGTV